MPNQISRRRLFTDAAVGTFAAAVALGNARAQSEVNSPKQSKSDAQYQDRPKSGQLCGVCAFFVAPESCARVAGDIRPTGWCKNFQLRT